ncbi:MAG TPA: DUF4326 domain-containing protein [Citreicella sp.]|jgi:hypothetical protein|uniref:DUF4326 domain-containing protein n=1 Tax=Salipiger marinus TaxID=555512 RepID=A0A1G8UEB1_9RHOB|nr:DUF4326 domain-containing protein [Salipiger marinus]SDJ52166.1 protein of unknown function [Salipiger marinus]HBM58056.1 DUF4326 domain-containing protein [Citreicella sp.]HBT01846.1 DUF4326 domain-containing protein [Citreicella sp.]|tara:strand:- start:372 stop:722 length:351 start_codon:yes stop_codon:yes gene_type:complete
MTPRRIQMSRARPWRAENPDAVIVARPTKWGNPFDFRAAAEAGYSDGRRDAADAFAEWLRGEDWGIPQGQTRAGMAAKLVVIRRSLHELRGHDLACWCPPGPCHADVLLRIANKEN